MLQTNRLDNSSLRLKLMDLLFTLSLSEMFIILVILLMTVMLKLQQTFWSIHLLVWICQYVHYIDNIDRNIWQSGIQ